MNLGLAFVFLIISLLTSGNILGLIGSYGFMINSWLALFNLIPFGNFDGVKILRWNKAVYFIMVAIALGFMFI